MIVRLFDRATKGIEYLCCLFFVLMCIGVTIQIFSRYIFASPVVWAEEVARYAMIWIVYLGAIVAVRRKAHTRIDFFVNLLPARHQRYVEVLVDCICIAFLAILLYSFPPALNLSLRMTSYALKVPLFVIHAALPLCGSLMIVSFMFNIVQTLRSKPENEQGEGQC